MAPTRRKAIIWNNGGLVYWRIYASLGPNELKCCCKVASYGVSVKSNPWILLSAKLLLPTAISRANDIVFQRCLQFYGSLTILLQVQVLPVAPLTNMV